MRRRPLVWKLFSSYLFLSIISVAAISIITLKNFESFVLEQTAEDLHKRARSFELIINSDFSLNENRGTNALVKSLGEKFSSRITLIDSEGKVIEDSESPSENMDNHLNRPEIRDLQSSSTGMSIRYSETLQKKFMYIAIKTAPNLSYSFLRVAVPLTKINDTLLGVYKQAALGIIVLILLLGIASFWLSKTVSRPIEIMKTQVQEIASGTFKNPISLSGSATKEHFELATAFNKMTSELEKRISFISRQSKEQETMFSSMVEGVIAVDSFGIILSMNQSAKEILGLADESLENENISKILDSVDHQNFSNFINKAKTSKFSVGEEILIGQKSTRYLYVQASPIPDTSSENSRLVIVISDMTKLKELELHRKEFVANVSHELRTPLTSIQGFSETLLEDDFNDKAAQKDFLQIINFNAKRLGAIFQDLLALSSIEKKSEEEMLETKKIRIETVIDDAICLHKQKGQDNNVNLRKEISIHSPVRVNSVLMVSAIGNLLENALNYSPENSSVVIKAYQESKFLLIDVCDEGIGIPKEHLARLFERFYRVDAARSRKAGGTGLGLSIVKHVAIAHTGSVSVKSIVNSGSTFTIKIPLS